MDNVRNINEIKRELSRFEENSGTLLRLRDILMVFLIVLAVLVLVLGYNAPDKATATISFVVGQSVLTASILVFYILTHFMGKSNKSIVSNCRELLEKFTTQRS